MVVKIAGQLEHACIVSATGAVDLWQSLDWDTPMLLGPQSAGSYASVTRSRQAGTTVGTMTSSSANSSSGLKLNNLSVQGTSATAMNDSSSGFDVTNKASVGVGVLKPDTVVAQLFQAWMDYTERLTPERIAETNRLARQQVLAEQEAAYAESLRQDRIKPIFPRSLYKQWDEEILKNIVSVALRKKAAAKADEEADAARREDLLRLQRERASTEANRRRISASRRVPKEPNDEDMSTSGGIATLRFRLPASIDQLPYKTEEELTSPEAAYSVDDSSDEMPIVQKGFISRRFFGDNQLKDVISYVESLGFQMEEFKLITTFPRKDLTAETDTSRTLAELGLVPQETLTLEER